MGDVLELCENCRFREESHQGPHYGECHHGPPLLQAPNSSMRWPNVSKHDWCGRFERRVDEKKLARLRAEDDAEWDTPPPMTSEDLTPKGNGR